MFNFVHLFPRMKPPRKPKSRVVTPEQNAGRYFAVSQGAGGQNVMFGGAGAGLGAGVGAGAGVNPFAGLGSAIGAQPQAQAQCSCGIPNHDALATRYNMWFVSSAGNNYVKYV